MQSSLWAHSKSAAGFPTAAFRIEGSRFSADMLLVERSPASDECIYYVPHGPDMAAPTTDSALFLQEVTGQIQDRLPRTPVGVRFDLLWPDLLDEDDRRRGRPDPSALEMRMNFGYGRRVARKAPTDMLPPDTVVIDLTPTTEQLLARMKAKTRYNIRTAGRHRVTVTPISRKSDPSARSRGYSAWSRLYSRTMSRHGLHDQDLVGIRELLFPGRPFETDCSTELLIAHAPHDAALDDPYAAAIIGLTRSRAFYLYGASERDHRAYMAPFALQWEAMQRAKRHGATAYDMCGIPPTDNPSHPLHGLLRFKSGFGGKIVHRSGCWDIPLDEARYDQLAGAQLAQASFHETV